MPKFAVTLKRTQEIVVHLNVKSKDELENNLYDLDSRGDIDNCMEGYFQQFSADYEFDIRPVKGRVKVLDHDKMMQEALDENLDYCED